MASDAQTWPQPNRLKRWVDNAGTQWARVGDRPLAIPAIRRLIEDESTSVLHFYGSDPVEVDATQRAALWQRMEPVVRAKNLDKPHSEFVAFKYRNGDRTMLAVEEHC